MLGESRLFRIAFALNMAARGSRLGPTGARFLYWSWDRLWDAFLWLRRPIFGEWAKFNLAGKSLKFDLKDRSVTRALYLFREYEPRETALVVRLLKPRMTFVDIGANSGYYSVLASCLVGEGGRVIAFEPDPENLRILRKNIRGNDLHNVMVEACAISSHDEERPLYLSEINSGDHRIYNGMDDDFYNAGRPRTKQLVKCMTLDGYFEGTGICPDFIKMDVQGAEHLALLGMRRTLHDSPEVKLLTEYWPHGLVRSGCEPKDFLAELEGLGFIIHTILSGGGLAPTTSKSIEASVLGKDSLTLFLSRKTPAQS